MLDLSGRLVLVVGGGRVAARKVASLLEAGARVRLVAPQLAPQTRALLPDCAEHRPREFESQDLKGAWLVVSATDDPDLNQRVAEAAGQQKVFVNVVDVPSLCSFIVPATFRRGRLTVALSSGGASPAAAAAARRRLQGELGPEWGPFLELMARVRRRVLAQGRPAQENAPLFKALVDSDLLARLAAGDAKAVEETLASILGPGFGLKELGLGAHELGLGRHST